MYGWRARVGHVSPAIYDTSALEYRRILPAGCMMVVYTLNIQTLVDSEFDRAWNSYEVAAQQLAREGAEFIIIGGDPVFARRGAGSDLELLERLYRLTGVPCTTSVTAAMEGLRHLGVRRVALATPYEEERNSLLARFFEGSGFEVAGVQGLGIRRNIDLARQPQEASYNVARKVVRESRGAQGVYLPCSRWPVVANLRALEEDTGIPVVCNAQAALWKALSTLHIPGPIQGYGRLMATL